MSYWDSLKADAHRLNGYYSRKMLIKAVLRDRTFRTIFAVRLCQAASKSKGLLRLFFLFIKLFHRLSTQLAGMDFPWSTTIGSGLAIHHGWGLVVNGKAKIGRNVTLLQGVTIGGRDRILPDGQRQTGYPIIEDEVWIGPHAIIVGGITVGRGSRIAGGSFVMEDVPSYSIVMGNPSKIVKSGCTPDVVNPAPISE